MIQKLFDLFIIGLIVIGGFLAFTAQSAEEAAAGIIMMGVAGVIILVLWLKG